jgi:hypothetical protein
MVVELDGDTFVRLDVVEQAIKDVRAQYDPVARTTLALLHDSRRAS